MSDDDQKDERPSEPLENQGASQADRETQKVTEKTETVTEPAETGGDSDGE